MHMDGAGGWQTDGRVSRQLAEKAMGEQVRLEYHADIAPGPHLQFTTARGPPTALPPPPLPQHSHCC